MFQRTCNDFCGRPIGTYMLPPISPPRGGSAAQPVASFEWTAHDVAEWAHSLGTSEDYSPAFLIHGPGVLSLGREELADWKVKPADQTIILQALHELRSAKERVSAEPGSPHRKDSPRKAAAPQQSLPPAKATQPLEATSRFQAGTPDSVQRVGSHSPRTPRSPRSPRSPRKQKTYLNGVMGDLHGGGAVPTWKEEVLKRAQRRTTSESPRAARAGQACAAAASEESAFLVTARSTTSERTALSQTQTSLAATATASGKAADLERQLFSYRDALSEQQLQAQMLEHRETQLSEQQARSLESCADSDGIISSARREHRLNKELNRLSRVVEVAMSRVSDAERLNRGLASMIDTLRKARSDFLRQMSRLAERERAMAADMKQLVALANCSLDEKEKVEARLKRTGFEHRQESADKENKLAKLELDIRGLEAALRSAHDSEDSAEQLGKQMTYRALRQKRHVSQSLDLRMGHLQNQVHAMEAEFQRVQRTLGLDPAGPAAGPCRHAVGEILRVVRETESRHASALNFLERQSRQRLSLETEIVQCETRAAELAQQQRKHDLAASQSQERTKRQTQQARAAEVSVEAQAALLRELCAPVQAIFELVGREAARGPTAAVAATADSCRPDTLCDHLRKIDEAASDLWEEASALVGLGTAQNQREDEEAPAVAPRPSVLQGFVAPHPQEEVRGAGSAPRRRSVFDTRMELERSREIASQRGLLKGATERSLLPTEDEEEEEPAGGVGTF